MSAASERDLLRIEARIRNWLDGLPQEDRESAAAKLSGFMAAQMALATDRRVASTLFNALGDSIVGTCPEVVP